MNPQPPFDIALAHQWFSADCFNRTWGLLDKAERTPEEDEQMISLAHASIAHWREREDCANQNLSIGYWQLSRIHAVLGRAENAKHYGQLCLSVSTEEPPFFLGYAHEALARAAKVAGDQSAFESHLRKALADF